MDEMKTMLKAILKSQDRMLEKLDRIEARFEEIGIHVEKTSDRQIKLEEELHEFKTTLVEQLRKYNRSDSIFH